MSKQVEAGDDGIEVIPEVLAGVPRAWLSPEFVGVFVGRERLATGVAAMAAQVATIEASHRAAIAAVAAGDVSAVGDLVTASAALVAANHAAASLPADVPADGQWSHAALERATQAMAHTANQLTVRRLAAEVQTEAWKTLCKQRNEVSDPPTVTDQERAAMPGVAKLQAEAAKWLTHRAGWKSTRERGSAAILDLLNSAAEYVESGNEIAGRVRASEARVDALNEQRTARGLTWNPVLGRQ